MKPEHIEVGTRYINTRHPEARYLGCGETTDQIHFKNKILVVINGYRAGCIVRKYQGVDDEFWNSFELDIGVALSEL